MTTNHEIVANALLTLRKRKATYFSKNKILFEEKERILDSGRKSFWFYCQIKNPDYYTDDKTYLLNFCEVLQNLYDGKLLNSDGKPYKKIIINMPPRFGKSRTLINFTQWVLGKNQSERIITCSYNDTSAGDFSKYTRDGIQEMKISEEYFVFSDFFPNVTLKKGSNSYFNWALEGQFFNYLGTGMGGSVTGKGGSILIIDDLIKLAEEAFNQERLEKIWQWYTGTFLSRGDAKGGEPIEIITMTRWADGDICGRILSSEEAKDWYVIKLEAYDEKEDKMLCEEVLSKERYSLLSKKMIYEIFRANYHQEAIDQKGRLYKNLKTYNLLPMDEFGKLVIEGNYNYTDTADEGDDYLCSICYAVYKGEAYITDVYYTKEGMEVTEPKTAEMLVRNNTNNAKIESNNGGRGFARNVNRIIWDNYKTRSVIISWFHQSENKIARIISQSSFVQEHIYFPINWKDRWPLFYKHVTSFMKEGKNANDDCADGLTGIAENVSNHKKVGAARSPY